MDYTSRHEPLPRIRYPTRKCIVRKMSAKRIRNLVDARAIPYLVHFTRMENVNSIACHGLLSRTELKERRLRFSPTDDYPLDWIRDHISASVSFPNYQMFYKKRKLLSGEWAVILIKKEVLWELDCRFFHTNAASGSIEDPGHEKWSTSQAFGKMFQLEVRGKSRSAIIPEYYTTDPQAEVIIKDKIQKKYIKEIVVEQRLAETDRRGRGGYANIPIKVRRELFWSRCDYKDWQSETPPVDCTGEEF